MEVYTSKYKLMELYYHHIFVNYLASRKGGNPKN
jgi:hypothetical protein